MPPTGPSTRAATTPPAAPDPVALYLLNLLVALDQLANAVMGGHPWETVSQRCAARRLRPGWARLARLIEWADPGHLDRAQAWNAAMKHLAGIPDARHL